MDADLTEYGPTAFEVEEWRKLETAFLTERPQYAGGRLVYQSDGDIGTGYTTAYLRAFARWLARTGRANEAQVADLIELARDADREAGRD